MAKQKAPKKIRIWKLVYFSYRGCLTSIDHPNDFVNRRSGRQYLKKYGQHLKSYRLVKFEADVPTRPTSGESER